MKQKQKGMKKRRNRELLLLSLFLLWCLNAKGQESQLKLSKDQFISIVKSYHPVMKVAALQVKKAQADIQAARGQFDPSITANLDRKSFDGKIYYSYFNPQITVPTWYGIDFKAGLEEVIGDRVSPESTLGKTSYIGVKLQANSLLFDKRRAALRQTQSLKMMSEEDKRNVLNDLLYNALLSYWNWVKEYQLYNTISENVKINEKRLRFVTTDYEQGFRPAIDTIEALAQLQNFYLQQKAAWLSFQNAGLELANYMWLDNNQPFEWSDQIIPDSIDNTQQIDIPILADLLYQTNNNHPKLKSISFKLDVLKTEKKLKAQYIIPKLSLNANLLNKGYSAPSDVSIPFLENNYKLGVNLSMPLFFREARGAYNAAKIKINQTIYEQDLYALQIENKLKSYYNEVTQLRQQIALAENIVVNYVRLLNGEKQKFEVGESSLFYINYRENKVTEAKQKLIELCYKFNKGYVSLFWASGQFD